MFEPNTPFVPENAAPASEDESQAGLRRVSWSELNARLAAARELRIALGGREDDAGDAASFDAEVARHVAHLHEPPGQHGKNRVNPDHSTNGKRGDGKSGARQEDWRPATRGRE
ncbi:hypothetical protein [Aurantiacibacter suaedae]|uniref:hypothetical protein n=1 Tax=Aurantiacibacter suaedae TaxID=2545755 RepID=UPI0010F7588B|nr:hypothetical protein [Aurantiacibacter suaedae]